MKTTSAHHPSGRTLPTSGDIDFHGACIVNERGYEIPITEQMIQGALHALDDAWCSEKRRRLETS